MAVAHLSQTHPAPHFSDAPQGRFVAPPILVSERAPPAFPVRSASPMPWPHRPLAPLLAHPPDAAAASAVASRQARCPVCCPAAPRVDPEACAQVERARKYKRVPLPTALGRDTGILRPLPWTAPGRCCRRHRPARLPPRPAWPARGPDRQQLHCPALEVCACSEVS